MNKLLTNLKLELLNNLKLELLPNLKPELQTTEVIAGI